MDGSGWKWWVGTAGAVVLGAVFLVAGIAKLYEPGAFVQQIRLEQLDFLFSAPVVAIIALALEAGLGIALLLGARHRLIIWPSTLMVIFFVFLTGRNYWLVSQGLRDPSIECGCFGSLIERTPAEAFWQDLFLLVPPLLLAALVGRVVQFPLKRIAVGLLVGLVVAVLGWRSPDLWFAEAAAQIAETPRESVFVKSDLLKVVIDGEQVDGKVFQSEADPRLLILSGSLSSPVLVNPLTQSFQLLAADSVPSDGEQVSLHESLTVTGEGPFEMGPGGIVFQVGEVTVQLRSAN